MKYSIQPKSLVAPVIIGVFAGLVLQNAAAGIAVFALSLIPVYLQLYIPYAKDNPKKYWFKRKIYGWGWVPVTWQGYAVTFIYIGSMIAFAFTIDESSPPNELMFTFFLPFILLTVALIRIAYKTGEKPKWQWGRED